jgi:hypothetical protein
MRSETDEANPKKSEWTSWQFVVPAAANIQEVVELWRRLMEIPDEIEAEATSGNARDLFWGHRTAAETIPCTLRTTNMHGDTCVFPGPDQFKADQIGRILDVKIPPIPQCQITPRGHGGAIIQFDGDVTPLGLKILREHLLAWNLEGRILEAPMVSTWWIPYDHAAIMRF